MRTWLRSGFQTTAAILLVIGIWESISRGGLVNASLFPPPSQIILAFRELAMSGSLLTHIGASIWRAILGLCVGTAIGILMGLFTGRNTIARAMVAPIIHIIRSFPPVAIIPLVIVWLGIGDTAKVFAISFGVFFPVWVNTHQGSRQIPSQYLHAARLLTKKAWKRWAYVILPGTLPFIIAGVRNGIAIAYIMVFVSELAGASRGVGYIISIAHLAYRIDRMIVGLMILGLLGATSDGLFMFVTRKLFPWIRKTT
ncbi:MAG: ABC transporter permease [archaeon]